MMLAVISDKIAKFGVFSSAYISSYLLDTCIGSISTPPQKFEHKKSKVKVVVSSNVLKLQCSLMWKLLVRFLSNFFCEYLRINTLSCANKMESKAAHFCDTDLENLEYAHLFIMRNFQGNLKIWSFPNGHILAIAGPIWIILVSPECANLCIRYIENKFWLSNCIMK